MTLVYYDPKFLEHDTGRGHPERAERLRRIFAQLESSGLIAECERPAWEPATRARIERIHEPGHIDRMISLANSGGGYVEPDTIVSSASADAAALAAGAACDAVDRLLRGEAETALCLARPTCHNALHELSIVFLFLI